MPPLQVTVIVVDGLIGLAPASALQLGRLPVKSRVGDPLRAEIEFIPYSA
jgi:Tfp pilus assembly protein FimV